MLQTLHSVLLRVKKPVTVFSKARMQLRLHLAEDELAILRQRLQSYRDTVQLSVTTVVLWHQIIERTSAPDIAPSLRDIDIEIRRLAELFTRRIEKLQSSEQQEDGLDLRVVTNLRDCVQSAASVVSSASTGLGIANSEHNAVRVNPDYGDCFPDTLGITMQRWTDARTENSYEPLDDESLRHRTGDSNARTDSDPASDTELEADIISSLLKRGQGVFATGQFDAAEKTLLNCLSRAESLGGNAYTRPYPRLMGTQGPTLQLLILIYLYQSRLDDAQTMLLKALHLHGKTDSEESRHDLETLVNVTLRKSDLAAAHRFGRQLLKACRKLEGYQAQKVITVLRALVEITRRQCDMGQEEAYNAVLVEMKQQAEHFRRPLELDVTRFMSSSQLAEHHPSSAVHSNATDELGNATDEMGARKSDERSVVRPVRHEPIVADQHDMLNRQIAVPQENSIIPHASPPVVPQRQPPVLPSQVAVVTIAFDLSDLSTLDNVLVKWAPEAARLAPGRPCLLVGCRSDRLLRKPTKNLGSPGPDEVGTTESYRVMRSRAQSVNKSIGAAGYFETSALSGEGVSELMRCAAFLARAEHKVGNPDLNCTANRTPSRQGWQLRAESRSCLRKFASTTFWQALAVT